MSVNHDITAADRVDPSCETRIFAFALAVAGLIGALSLPATGLTERGVSLAVLTVLAACAGTLSVRIPGVRVEFAPGDSFIFASLAIVGPFAATVVAVAAVAGAAARPGGSRLSIRTVFNVGAAALAATAAGWTYAALQRSTLLPASELVAMFGAVGAYVVVNTLLVALVIHQHAGTPVLRAWRHAGLWSVTASLTDGLLAFGLVGVVAIAGPLGLFFGLLGAFVVAGSHRSRRHLLAVERLERATAPAGPGAAIAAPPSPVTLAPSFLPPVS